MMDLDGCTVNSTVCQEYLVYCFVRLRDGYSLHRTCKETEELYNGNKISVASSRVVSEC